MTLHFIGLGLNDKKDISLKGLEAIKECNNVYLEYYTCILHSSKEELEELYGKPIILADRELVEKKAEETILKDAKESNTAFLVIGDPMAATTHVDLAQRAKKLGIDVNIIHNASVINAIGETGLELYKFGKTTSICFEQGDYLPETPYDVIKLNQQNGLHTLCLLDIKVKEESIEHMKEGKKVYEKPRFMSIAESIRTLIKIEDKRKENVFNDDTLCIGCARLGSKDKIIRAGKASEILKLDFGKEVHCLIVPGKLHFMEKEYLENF
ncbi:diphthine synthase [Candidatus Woesearchaeota archaeon]|jgi:diphthine methyl ester synthase|nr:diphthine synthase [Candidatus Woesearchaeota archaeon]MBT3538194.1 diphthine synthase [Candidatus Woesearchaeota archaeon]MBT4697447.1 diphthine synthase [Candidatus Woesearchaeota archaeon]MBT4716613.1 diphthine synthase [Candidatus Woesearchaeota archaeon]MBT7105863.1 diphthine synthase [Candidatus Woesearchaeota archaeon]